jgi:hypothetical protein
MRQAVTQNISHHGFRQAGRPPTPIRVIQPWRPAKGRADWGTAHRAQSCSASRCSACQPEAGQSGCRKPLTMPSTTWADCSSCDSAASVSRGNTAQTSAPWCPICDVLAMPWAGGGPGAMASFTRLRARMSSAQCVVHQHFGSPSACRPSSMRCTRHAGHPARLRLSLKTS